MVDWQNTIYYNDLILGRYYLRYVRRIERVCTHR